MVFCTQCGHPMEEGKKFCNKCGAPMQQRTSVPLTPPTPEEEPPQAPATESFAAMGETMILQDTTAPNQAPGAEAPISKEVPVREAAIPPVRFQEQSASSPEKPKRKLFPIIFFPILGVCLTVLLILCLPRISRLVWGIAHKDDDSYSDIYMEETAPTADLPTVAPATQAPATESTLSPEAEMYAEAHQLMSEERYDEARELFATLGDYLDSAEMVLKIDYLTAEHLYASGDFEAARDLFAVLGNYNDSVSLRQKCDFEIAHNYLRQNDLASAAELLFAAGKELYDAGVDHVELTDGYCIDIQDNDDYAIKTPGLYFTIHLSHIICIYFDEQGNIIEWGKYYPESFGYEIGNDDVFEYIF